MYPSLSFLSSNSCMMQQQMEKCTTCLLHILFPRQELGSSCLRDGWAGCGMAIMQLEQVKTSTRGKETRDKHIPGLVTSWQQLQGKRQAHLSHCPVPGAQRQSYQGRQQEHFMCQATSMLWGLLLGPKSKEGNVETLPNSGFTALHL